MSNYGFENGLEGWTAFTLKSDPEGFTPELGIESLAAGASHDAVLSGDKSVRFKSPAVCHWTVLYQQLAVTPGAGVKLAATGKAWASDNPNAFPKELQVNMNAYLTVGIDPMGGTDPTIDGIRWKKVFAGSDNHNIDQLPLPVWVTAEVTGVSIGKTVTIFAGMDMGGLSDGGGGKWRYPAIMGFLDNVSVSISGDSGIPPVVAPDLGGDYLLQLPIKLIRMP